MTSNPCADKTSGAPRAAAFARAFKCGERLSSHRLRRPRGARALPSRPGSRSFGPLHCIRVKREGAQPLQPGQRLAAVDDGARQRDPFRDGLGAPGDHQSQSALQHQRVEMRAAIAAFEHIEQRFEIRLGIPARQARAANNAQSQTPRD